MMKTTSPSRIISTHAGSRISGRLAGLVSDQMVSFAERLAQVVGSGKYYVELARFDREVHLPGNVNGDVIVAVIRQNQVSTVMLGKSWKKAYFADGRYVVS